MKRTELRKLIKEQLLREGFMYTPEEKEEYTNTIAQLDDLITTLRNNKLIQADTGLQTMALNIAVELNKLQIGVKEFLAKK